MPFDLAAPSGTAASQVAYSPSKLDRADGSYVTSTRWAAATTATTSEAGPGVGPRNSYGA